MSNSVIEEARKRRLAKQEEEKLKKEGVKFNNFDTGESITWMGLESNKEKVMRIVGDPFEIENRKPTDAKIILFSEWLDDESTSFVKVNWEFVEDGEKFKPDSNWLLTRLYNAINAGEWAEYTEDMIDPNKGIREKDGQIVNKWGRNVYWKNLHVNKKCFDYLKGDLNRRKKDRYPRPIYPRPRVLLNVIDRHDDWCKENNKTKVLSSSVTPYIFDNDKGESTTIYYIDRGVPIVVYKKLWDDVVGHRGHWNTVDVIITKKQSSSLTEYSIRDALEDKISEESKKIANADPLTDKEKEYELWNLDERFKPLSYYRMRKYFLKRFKLADLELGTNFSEELEDLASDEEKKFKEENKERESNEIFQMSKELNNNDSVDDVVKDESLKTEDINVNIETDNVVVEDNTQQERRKRRDSAEDNSNESVENLKYWNSLSKEDKDDILDNMKEFINGECIWKDNANLLPCDNQECKKTLPSTVLQCPYCNQKFEAA